MENRKLKILDYLIKKLELLRSRYQISKKVDLAYSSLSPISNGDENGHYSNALAWALENRDEQDIKNIALTGSYGSGKSSILKTFQRNYTGKDLQFLNISLATFEEESPQLDRNGKKIKIDKSELLRLIEISILEQIFFHEEDSKIPDSRFKKIKSYSGLKLFLISLGYLVFTLSAFNYFNPYFLQGIFKDFPFSNWICNVLHYCGILIIGLGIFYLIRRSVRILSSITVNKLKFQNAEIGFGDSQNKSVLNHHIDEILYFFSVRPYNVVIIEDLDRFKETDIFTKLREVNLLLNSSQKTKKKRIVFVYAVRDDMFTDKDRTKFFDFIIPVIPVINSSNSSEILLRKKEKFEYDLPDNFLEDMSFYIDDMRLLHNICNEFYLYKKKLNESLNQRKLFAIITYKNIYPNDFMKLSNNEGNIYKIFNSKALFIRNSLETLEKEIEECRTKIIHYEDLFISSVEDLRRLYILRIIENLPGFESFNINDSAVSLDSVLEDGNFEYIKSNSYTYNQLRFNSSYGREDTRKLNYNKKFEEIEKLVDGAVSFSEKEIEIKAIMDGKIQALKQKIQIAETEKQKVRNLKIAELLRINSLPDITLTDNLNKDFIRMLLRNEYISEDYIDYITLFHEGSITRTDYQFHINIKNSTRLPFDYKLAKIEKLLQKINPLDFESEYILNFDLLDYLLSLPDKYNSELESLFNKLKDESKISIQFIKEYYAVTQHLELFIELLCNKWNNIWVVIESNSDFTEDLKDAFFKSIIEHTDLKVISNIAKQSAFNKRVLSNPLFLNITNNTTRLKEVIDELKLFFVLIDFQNSPEEMISFIYTKNFYQLNLNMVGAIIKKFGSFNQVDFDNSNYFAVKNSNADQLIKNVEDNINDYISNVYLKLSTNVNEKEETLISLLNNEDISINNREALISQTETKIDELSVIENYEIRKHLLEYNKILASWHNLLFDYNNRMSTETEEEKSEEVQVELEISVSSISFLNIIDNAEVLSKTKIPKLVDTSNIYGKFWRKLLETNLIEDQSYDKITKSSPWWYSDLKIELLSEKKVKSLINNTCINPVFESYSLLKQHFDGLNIYLLETRKNEYLKLLDKLEFDGADLELVLKSQQFTNSEKSQILNKCNDETIITDNNLKLISAILLSDGTFTVRDTILTAILNKSNIPVIERLRLILKNSTKYDLAFIEPFLAGLDSNYSAVTDKGSKAKLPKNQDNLNLLNMLKRKGYISSYSEKSSNYIVNHKRK